MGNRSVRPSHCGELHSLPERLARLPRRLSFLPGDFRHFTGRSVANAYQLVVLDGS